MNALSAKLTDYKTVKDRLLAEYPSLRDDDDALCDTLEGCTDLPDALCGIMRAVDDDETAVAAIKDRIKQLQARADRIAARAIGRRDIVAAAMQDAGLKRLPMHDMTVTISARPPSVVVTDEAALPNEFLVFAPPKPNKTAIKDALKAGREIPGAMLSNGGMSLTVRKG